MIRLRLEIFTVVTLKMAVIGLGYLVLLTGLSALPALKSLKLATADCSETLAATYKNYIVISKKVTV
jgi:hypothetical protein